MYRLCPIDGRTPVFLEERHHLEPIIDGTVLGPDNALNYGMAKVFMDEMEAKTGMSVRKAGDPARRDCERRKHN
jgi:hypothetical protein